MAADAEAAQAFVGCSGYDYPHWRGVFYPPHLPRARWFEYYAAHFRTVELNATFYGLPVPETVARWRERAPGGFVHAVKMSRYGTHRRKLADPAGWLAVFCERIDPLGPSLGPVLVQLPARWRRNVDRLSAFLEAAPAHHRWAVEVRDESWLHDDVYALLAEHGAALVHHDLIDDHPWELTAGWTYVRRHGAASPDHPYVGGYSAAQLGELAETIGEHLAGGRDVYCYFNNDAGGNAPRDAAALLEML